MSCNYIFESVDGNKTIFTREQIVANARWQRDEQNVTPMYCRDFGRGEYSRPGFLVASGNNGAIVVVFHDNGNATIFHAWQGDFIIRLDEARKGA